MGYPSWKIEAEYLVWHADHIRRGIGRVCVIVHFVSGDPASVKEG